MRTTLLPLAFVIACGVPAGAQKPVASLADLGTRVQSGDSLRVTDGSMTQTIGAFAKVSDSTLSLLVGGQLRDMPFTDIREVARRGDSVRNGFLIGAGIGAAWGTFVGASYSSGVGTDGVDAGAVVIFAAVDGLMFGGIGALIDHFRKGHTVVYKIKSTALRVEPHVSLDRRAVSLSMGVSRR